MVIAFEEKDRKLIESNGVTIIEFKWILNKVCDCIVKLWKSVKKITEIIMDAFSNGFESINEIAENLKKEIEDILNQNLTETERYKIVRYYAKANNPSTIPNKNKLYHCRNNC